MVGSPLSRLGGPGGPLRRPPARRSPAAGPGCAARPGSAPARPRGRSSSPAGRPSAAGCAWSARAPSPAAAAAAPRRPAPPPTRSRRPAPARGSRRGRAGPTRSSPPAPAPRPPSAARPPRSPAPSPRRTAAPAARPAPRPGCRRCSMTSMICATSSSEMPSAAWNVLSRPSSVRVARWSANATAAASPKASIRFLWSGSRSRSEARISSRSCAWDSRWALDSTSALSSSGLVPSNSGRSMTRAQQRLHLQLGHPAVGHGGQQHRLHQRGVALLARLHSLLSRHAPALPRFVLWSSSAPRFLRLGASAEKSKTLLSSRWLGRTLLMAESTLWRTLGISLPSSSISRCMRLRCRFSCEPHRSQGMMGKLLGLGERRRSPSPARSTAGG